MRKDIPGWEKYQEVLDDVIAGAIHWQDRHGHPHLPALALLAAAEQMATRQRGRELALRYGDLNDAVAPFLVPESTALRDVTKDIGPGGVLVHLASYAMVADAKQETAWINYEREYARCK